MSLSFVKMKTKEKERKKKKERKKRRINHLHLSEIAFSTRSAPASLQGVVPQTMTWYCPILDLFLFFYFFGTRKAKKKKV